MNSNDSKPAVSFRDRSDAGCRLGRVLMGYAKRGDVVVLALPRGGVPVAFEVAKALKAPLDVLVVRKLGFPGHEELAIGAVASGGIKIFNQEIADLVADAEIVIPKLVEKELEEVVRRETVFRKGRPAVNVKDRTVILVDDGIATGATMRAAVAALRLHGVRKIVVAVPVASEQAYKKIKDDVDASMCLLVPPNFAAVGQFYNDFSQTTDEEVSTLLEQLKGTSKNSNMNAKQ